MNLESENECRRKLFFQDSGLAILKRAWQKSAIIMFYFKYSRRMPCITRFKSATVVRNVLFSVIRVYVAFIYQFIIPYPYSVGLVYTNQSFQHFELTITPHAEINIGCSGNPTLISSASFRIKYSHTGIQLKSKNT